MDVQTRRDISRTAEDRNEVTVHILWNNLSDSTDFSTLTKFNTSVNNYCLLKYCKLNFT